MRNIKHIGIVACSAEGAALCYRTLCNEAQDTLGEHMHPEITLHNYPLGDYMVYITQRDWEQVAQMMLSSVRKLADAGADFAICPDNTIHEAYDFVVADSPIPWLHIAECVAMEAQQHGYRKLGILGTKYIMTGPVYPEVLNRFDIASEHPQKEDRERINEIIFKQLVNSIFHEESRRYFNRVIDGLKDRGCDAVVLGCTEIPLLVDPADCPLPTLDSTRLLARQALKRATE
ncbi:MAG TPA: amino acid racemase [bacterium]|nr:amino acid racemase [bacterium]